MDVLLIGGEGAVINSLINKFRKEGHRIYWLTGSNINTGKYRKVFVRYNFAYDQECVKEIFESVRPDLVIYTGAYDTNFTWKNVQADAVRYLAGLSNLLLSCRMQQKVRFLYFSSEEVYTCPSQKNQAEDFLFDGKNLKAVALYQAEKRCMEASDTFPMDMVILRLDHLYGKPFQKRAGSSLCSSMCLEAIRTGRICADKGNQFSLLYLDDAVENIYRVVKAKAHQNIVYNISSCQEYNEFQVAGLIKAAFNGNVDVIDNTTGFLSRIVLSNDRFDREFGISIRHTAKDGIAEIVKYLLRHRGTFVEAEDTGQGKLGRFYQKFRSVIDALIPFVENLIFFIPFFMLNNRAVGSNYFSGFDFYLLYVLIFAAVYGQRQATLSALLATGGYLFRQMYTRTGFQVMVDCNTYVWVVQLFIVGLSVGYLRDKFIMAKQESKDEVSYLNGRLNDITKINAENARMKNILEVQLTNQTDSLGKIYAITSELDHADEGEVLFRAAKVVSNLMETADVAIYTVANSNYARLFSATSPEARSMGNSLRFGDLGDLTEALASHRVFINKKLEKGFPLMASAIYDEDKIAVIIMLWNIPWERMTLSQANMLTVIGLLIQNAVVRANRYLEVLRSERYIGGTNILEKSAFEHLVALYRKAKVQGLTECCVLKIKTPEQPLKETEKTLKQQLRQSDYLGSPEQNVLYALLSNTNDEEAQFVIKRLKNVGFESEISKG